MAAENMELSELFVETGNQIMSINTLFQLLALKKYQPEVWKKADKLLMMPDLIQYSRSVERLGEKKQSGQPPR